METDDSEGLLTRRLALRDAQLGAIASVARRRGAVALHIFGSIGRGTADALSDVDARLTFADDAIDRAVHDRWSLYAEIDEVLISHEMTPNRPPGDAYTLVLYATPVGLLQVDWHLVPAALSRIDPSARTMFAEVAVPLGDVPTDDGAEHLITRSERIDWLACMLFVAIKAVARGGSENFIAFLGQRYRDVCDAYGFVGCIVTEPVSLTAVGTMLRQLGHYADERQRRALLEIDAFQRQLAYARTAGFEMS